jgi:DNA-binding Lrp family transcriptional regulator
MIRRTAEDDGKATDMRTADTRLIALLRANAREPTASLARKLGLARSTVQDRIARLEHEGTIKGYTVKLAEEDSRHLKAVVMISTDPKWGARVEAELKKMPDVRSLATVSGASDLIATVEAETAAKLDAALDRIGHLAGVARTVSSIILSEKFSR